ncbi:MAG: cellulose synthase (UDP-forming), partial [Gammaproteobacteria bacterium]
MVDTHTVRLNWADTVRGSLRWTPLILTLAVIYLLHLGLTYFDATRQLILGWGSLAILVLTFKLNVFKRPPWRFVFIIVAAFLAVRYLVWRSTVSLVYTGLWDFIGMTALYLAEVYSMMIHLLGLFVNLWPMRNRPALLPTDTEQYPTVDVFIPTYN